MQFYSVCTRPGQEQKVVVAMARRVAAHGLQTRFGRVLAPTETYVDPSTRRPRNRRLFSGYVLVEMEVDLSTLHLVRSTPGVMGFLGGSPARPAPLSDAEVERLLRLCEPRPAEPAMPDFSVGDKVGFTEARYANVTGEVVSLAPNRGRLAVRLTLFGHTVVTDVSASQVRRLK